MEDIDAAMPLLMESLTIKKEIGEPRGVASCLRQIGIGCYKSGDLLQAETYLIDALSLNRETNDLFGEANTLLSMAQLEREQGRYASAWESLQSSLRIQQRLNTRLMAEETLDQMSQLLTEWQQNGEDFQKAIGTLRTLSVSEEQIAMLTDKYAAIGSTGALEHIRLLLAASKPPED